MCDHKYATTSSGIFVEIISMRTEDDGDWCLVVHHESATEAWVKADTLTRLN
jgi:hypothetical protein